MKFQITYLIGVIFFLLVSFFYLLDKWKILAFEEYLPGLDSPVLSQTFGEEIEQNKNEANSLDWDEMRKMRESLDAERVSIQEQKAKLAEKEQVLLTMSSEIAEREKKLKEEKDLWLASQKRIQQLKIEQDALVGKIVEIEPEVAVKILKTMSDQDVFRLLLQVDEKAKKNNIRSTSPYLLSLLPQQKSGRILTLMLKSNESNRAKEWKSVQPEQSPESAPDTQTTP